MKTLRFTKDEFVDDDSWATESSSSQISALTRRNLYDELILMGENSRKWFWGRFDLTMFLKRIWPLEEMPSTDSRFENAEGDIWQHMINNDDWTYYYLFNYLGLTKGPDDQFLRFLEEITHPVVRQPDEQEEFVSLINRYIINDGFELQPREQISGYPIYRAVKLGGARVEQEVRNLIFAADGPKPQIVLEDSISNNIRVTKNEEFCLVYDAPIPQTGLRWSDLVAWWANRVGHESPTVETERDLYNRLYKSLASEPEKLFFFTYFEKMRPGLGDKLPALIPQVYLHYDPYTLRELQGNRRLSRQRMDFLFLFSNHERVVIEVDGKQHYSDGDTASPEKYAEMVAADRQLRLSGYEVYRFGGYELRGDSGKLIAEEFVRKLFKQHRVG